MLYVGLDVHSRQSSLCILNAAGGVVNEVCLKGPRSAVVDRLRQLDEPFDVCYEASCGYGHLYEQLRPLARHVAVAHPAKLRLIYKDKRKNDRVDAQKLAKMLLLDMVPRVHVPHVDVRAWRSLIILRQRVMTQVACGPRTRSAPSSARTTSPAPSGCGPNGNSPGSRRSHPRSTPPRPCA